MSRVSRPTRFGDNTSRGDNTTRQARLTPPQVPHRHKHHPRHTHPTVGTRGACFAQQSQPGRNAQVRNKIARPFFSPALTSSSDIWLGHDQLTQLQKITVTCARFAKENEEIKQHDRASTVEQFFFVVAFCFCSFSLSRGLKSNRFLFCS